MIDFSVYVKVILILAVKVKLALNYPPYRVGKLKISLNSSFITILKGHLIALNMHGMWYESAL